MTEESHEGERIRGGALLHELAEIIAYQSHLMASEKSYNETTLNSL